MAMEKAHMVFDDTSVIHLVPQQQQQQQQEQHQHQQQQQQHEPLQPQSALARKSSKGAATRHRASVACASCRDRRIRCVVPEGARECTQCERNGTECIIKHDDERRRPVSKAYTASLTERIALLEGMLKEHGAEPPVADYPPSTRAEARGRQGSTETTSRKQKPTARRQSQSQSQVRNMSHNRTSPKSLTDDDGELGRHPSTSPRFDIVEGNSPRRIQDSKTGSLVDMLTSTRGHLSFDQLNGRLRFFGPTTNYHIYAAGQDALFNMEPREQARRTERIIRSLSMETHDYLMELFWEYYNSVLHIVHKEAFNDDRENSRTKYYSGFLHICILAIGYRLSDTSRDDIKRITIGHRESTLHREAKYMLDVELERPGGLPSVQAFLLLGDLECGVGRDNTGWMFAGMANRLCFDIGLHLDCGNEDLPEKEIQIRNMTLFACVIYDKYWGLFLGRPTGIKSSDLEMYRLSNQFASLGRCQPAGATKSLETEIYEHLLELMELAGKIIEIQDTRITATQAVSEDAYLQVMNLDRQLQAWYRRLPEKLAWKSANIQTAPSPFFLLHQQYHCSLILLHRPWAKYDEDQAESDSSEDDFTAVDNNYSHMSRSICTRQGIRVAQIFWHHRQCLDIRKCFVTGLQHAGTAATALVAELAVMKDVSERKNNMKYLECLAMALHDMGPTYQPAESMSNILQAVMVELSESRDKTSPIERPKMLSTMAPRRQSLGNDEHAEQRHFKRRASSKSGMRPEISPPEFARPTPVRAPPSFRKPADSSNDAIERDRRDNNVYSMITPHSDGSSIARPLSMDGDMQNEQPSMTQHLEYPLGAFGMDLENIHDGSMWSGDPMAMFQHGLTGLGDEQQWREDGIGKNHELDFLAL